MNRIVCWYSCGAASAVAAKLAIDKYKDSGNEIVVAYTEIEEEHPDNKRFLRECETWFDRPILLLRNENYSASIYEVFGKTKYLVGPAGAACTRLLKKEVRKRFEKPEDIHIFGFTVEERERAERFLDQNNVRAEFPLIENNLTKQDCFEVVAGRGILLPMMYRLGYKNNNCIGCVKGGSGYWNKIRRDFPETFARMAKQERILGRTICKYKGERIYLDEMPDNIGRYETEKEVQCGILCELTEGEK